MNERGLRIFLVDVCVCLIVVGVLFIILDDRISALEGEMDQVANYVSALPSPQKPAPSPTPKVKKK
jgi:hypothetical protein